MNLRKPVWGKTTPTFLFEDLFMNYRWMKIKRYFRTLGSKRYKYINTSNYAYPRLCINCKHFKRNNNRFWLLVPIIGPILWFMWRISGGVDFAKCKKVSSFCSIERGTNWTHQKEYCGKGGRLYEGIDTANVKLLVKDHKESTNGLEYSVANLAIENEDLIYTINTLNDIYAMSKVISLLNPEAEDTLLDEMTLDYKNYLKKKGAGS